MQGHIKSSWNGKLDKVQCTECSVRMLAGLTRLIRTRNQ